jgi:hypothetical protein
LPPEAQGKLYDSTVPEPAAPPHFTPLISASIFCEYPKLTLVVALEDVGDGIMISQLLRFNARNAGIACDFVLKLDHF